MNEALKIPHIAIISPKSKTPFYMFPIMREVDNLVTYYVKHTVEPWMSNFLYTPKRLLLTSKVTFSSFRKINAY